MREDSAEQAHGGSSSTTFHLARAQPDDGVALDMVERRGEARASTMPAPCERGRPTGPSNRLRRGSAGVNTRTVLLSALATLPGAMAQSCISLSGSTQCPAFPSASISTGPDVAGLLSVPSATIPSHLVTAADHCRLHSPFLQFVSNTQSFDQQLSAHVATSYVQQK